MATITPTAPRPTRSRPASRPAPRPLRRGIAVGEIISFAYETFNSNKIRFALTALGMVIGTAQWGR